VVNPAHSPLTLTTGTLAQDLCGVGGAKKELSARTDLPAGQESLACLAFPRSGFRDSLRVISRLTSSAQAGSGDVQRGSPSAAPSVGCLADYATERAREVRLIAHAAPDRNRAQGLGRRQH
jgi:hypothetical protein